MKNHSFSLFDIARLNFPVCSAQNATVLNFFSSFINGLRSNPVIKPVYCLTIFLLLMPMEVLAVEATSSQLNSSTVITTDPMSGSYLFQLILGLIVVLISIVALAWFAKRMNRLQSSTGGMLKIVGGISLGSRERVVLLQVGSEQLLLGVSPGRINTLHVLDSPLEEAANSSEKTFATNLAEAVFQKSSASYRQKTNDA